MRIRSTGSSAGRSVGSGADRGAAFRRLHRPGEYVTGRVLRLENETMAWVAFDGEPLLTTLANCPPPGSQLTFLVQQTHPEIMLKEAPFRHGGSTGSLPDALQSFHAARSAFEALQDGRDPLPAGRAAFLAALKADSDTELGSALDRVQAAAETINAALAASGPGTQPRGERLFYPPWIAPRGRQLELLADLPADGLGRAVLGLRLPDFGMVQIRAMLRPPLLRCRVYAEAAQNAARLAPLLAAALPRPDAPWDMECLGAEPLPRRYRGGLLAELLAPRAASFTL